MLRVAFDIGGTFTDCVLHDGDSGLVRALKVPSTPADPAEGVLRGLYELLSGADVAPAEVAAVLRTADET